MHCVYRHNTLRDLNNNEWHNLCLEDIGIFWELPNFDEQKHYYFQAVNFSHEENSSPVVPISPDELVEDHYKWKLNENTHRLFEKSFGAIALAFTAITYLAL